MINFTDGSSNPNDPQRDENEKIKELGYPGKPAPPVGNMPAGEGKYVVPHYETFQGLYNLASRAYRYTFDDALRASPANARAMRRDPVLMQALRARQMPTAQLSWHIEPQDETDNEQAEAAKKITEIIQAIPKFQRLKMSLLEAIWYGRMGVQLIYNWDFSRGDKRMVIVDHKPVNGDKLQFKWSGDVGLLVNSAYPGEKTATDRGMCHFLTPMERESFIVHNFEPEDSDFFEPELGGSIEGIGVRGRLYWFWFMKQNIFALLTNYLERCALGFTIFYYDAGNDASRAEVEAYAKTQLGQQAILWPRYRDQPNGGYGIERVEPGTSGAQLLESLVTQYFDDVMTRYILGQELSSTAGPSGMGSGLADLHSDTLSRILKYDATDLEETLTQDLVSVLYKYNCENIPHGRFKFELDDVNATEVLGYSKILYEMGGQINLDELYEIAGLTKPGVNDTMTSKLGEMQASSIQPLPDGVPAQGATGPSQVQPTQQSQQVDQNQQSEQPASYIEQAGNTNPQQ
jgi:hypothetical protein